MQYMKTQLKCKGCMKPVARRLGLFQANDDYECYAESYVKCFWGMCDNHKSVESFAKEPETKAVITSQPRSDKIVSLTNPDLIVKEIILAK